MTSATRLSRQRVVASAIFAAALSGLIGGTAAADPLEGQPTETPAAGIARSAVIPEADFADVAPLADAVTAPIVAKAQRVLALLDDGAALDEGELASLRSEIAAFAARQTRQDVSAMQQAWGRSDRAHLAALMAATTQIGVPYRRMRSAAGVGFDCSGLTKYAWSRAGVALPRTSGAQIGAAAARDADTAQAGDLVYYPGHVMLTLGVGNGIIHAPYSGQRVRFDHTRHKSLRYGDPTG